MKQKAKLELMPFDAGHGIGIRIVVDGKAGRAYRLNLGDDTQLEFKRQSIDVDLTMLVPSP